MNDITFAILKIVITIVSLFITYYVIPILKNKVKSQKNEELIRAIEVIVKAVEQTTSGSGMGVFKKDKVITLVREWLNGKNIDITEDQLNQLIEAAVYNMNNENISTITTIDAKSLIQE